MDQPAAAERDGVDVERLPTLLGQPAGLYTLFFAEMWERFSYYGMRALLVLYLLKGFLHYRDEGAYAVYGAYTGLVYLTPLFGGLLADRLLGARRAVVLGGLLMAAGHLAMTLPHAVALYAGLGFLIAGNGLFKPNISAMVGTLYAEHDPRRDAGFTVFYMGINLGGAAASLLCGYVGETWGWSYGFGLATVGMLLGLAVFVLPTRVARGLVLLGALLLAASLLGVADNVPMAVVTGIVAVALGAAGTVAFVALGRGGVPEGAGRSPDGRRLLESVRGLSRLGWVRLGAVLAVPVLGLLVWSNRTVRVVPPRVFEPMTGSGSAALRVVGAVLSQISTVPGLLVLVVALGALGMLLREAARQPRVQRERLWALVALIGLVTVAGAFFAQIGSSVNTFTDRNVDRVVGGRVLTHADVGRTVDLVLTQAQIGHVRGGKPLTPDALDAARAAGKDHVAWRVGPGDVGMRVGGSEIPAATFQAANPLYILLFGLVLSSLWEWLGRRGLEPGTPVKFGLGIAQLGLGFGVLWYAAAHPSARGMVGMSWLLLAYLLLTTAELCIAPIGLSVVTRLPPARLVGTALGTWLLVSALSNLLGAIVATFTRVDALTVAGGVPLPVRTVGLYGQVFGAVALASLALAVITLLLAPRLSRWMHEEGG